MDSSEKQRLWNEIEDLKARVATLEKEKDTQNKRISVSSTEVPPILSSGEKLSFSVPERPSLESRIGSQVFNRIGIVAILIGCAGFLQYAVDKSWLGPGARVAIGLVAGIILIAWAERFHRRSFPVFSYSLRAVGTGVLYLSLWAAFLMFHLVPGWLAFLGMVVVTASNGALCFKRRSQLLAALAAIGGFLTPLLLGDHAGSTLALGTYLILLNSGLFALVVARRWPRLLPGAFVGTAMYLLPLSLGHAILFTDAGWQVSLVIVTLCFLSFAGITVPVSRMESEGQGISVGISVANMLLGFFEIAWLLPHRGNLRDWLAGIFALFAFALLAAMRSRPAVAAALAPTYAGLGIAFAALWVFTAFSGGWVVAGWAVEALVLAVLAGRLREPLGGPAILSPYPAAALLVSASSFLAYHSIAGSLRNVMPAFFNIRCGLYFLLLAVAVLVIRTAATQHASQHHALIGRQWRQVAAGGAVLVTLLLLFAGVVEFHTFWGSAWSQPERFSDSAWAGGLGTALLVAGFRVRWSFLRWQALALLTLAIAKVFLFDMRELSQGFRILSILGLGILLLAISFIYQRDLLHLRGREHGE